MTDKKQMDVLRQSQLLKVYNDMLTVVKKMLDDKVDPEILASTLVAQGLRLYRGIMDQKTFDETIQVIVNNSKNMSIKPLFEFKQDKPKEEKIN